MTPRKQGVILSYILMVFEVLSTLLMTPFILRTLGQAEYGVYKLSVSITAYLLLLDLGVGNAIVRYLSKFRVNHDKDNAEKFLGIATLFYGGIALLSIIGGGALIAIFPYAFAKGLSPDEISLGQQLLIATTLNVAVTLGTAAYSHALTAYEKFTISRGASIIQIIIRVSLFYVCLKAGMGSLGLVYVQLFTTLLCRVFYVIFVTYSIKLKPVFHNLETSFVKEVAVYSSLILLQMIATQLNASIGQFLIGMIVASSAALLGIYSIGTQVVQYYQSIGSAFSHVLMPGLVKLVESRASSDRLCGEMVRIGRIVLILLSVIWGAYVVCGKDFVILWAGEENSEAWIVSLILMSAYMIVLTESVGNQILWAMNAHKEQSFAKLFIVILNIGFSIILIKWNALMGAALGTFISLIVGDIVVMNVIFVKKIGIRVFDYYKGLLKGIMPSLIIAIIIGEIIGSYLPLSWGFWVVKVLSVVVPYAVCMYVFGLNTYEKKLILNPIIRFIKK